MDVTQPEDKQTLNDKMQETKMIAKVQFDALIQNAKDPLGQKALIDQVWADIMKTREFEEADRTGRPIDMVEAERITAEIDNFILQSKKIPGLGKYGLGGGLSHIQRMMHHRMDQLRKKAETQGVVEHPSSTVKPTSQEAGVVMAASSSPKPPDSLEAELAWLSHVSTSLYGDKQASTSDDKK